jgi:DNA-binding transcriptional regulator YbjK
MHEDVPGGRARLSQERSRQRREQLIDAAARLFVEGGSKAVTHRSVSEAAQVPLATVSYYFASIDQLVDVMFGETLALWTEEWRALRPEDGATLTPEECAARFVSTLRSVPPERPAQHLNVYLAAMSRPHLLESVHAMRDSVMSDQQALVAASGIPDPAGTTRGLALLYSGALVAASDRSAPLDGIVDLLEHEVATRLRRELASG